MFKLRSVHAVALFLLLSATLARAADEITMTLSVEDLVIGRTMTYLGPSVITGGPSEEVVEKYIRDSGFNTTKYWLDWDVHREIANRPEFYGPRTREIAIRQVKEELDKIDWGFELRGGAERFEEFERQLDMCKKLGVQPVIDCKGTTRTELDRQVFWRWVFLFNVWANKVKKYDFVLWELASEHTLSQSVREAEIGSDALGEAVKVTGVKVKIAAPGSRTWTREHTLANLEGMLSSKAGNRLDAFSFHSFNFFSTFPKPSEYPTHLEYLQRYDEVQRKVRPHKPFLPYWDTSWAWRTRPGGEHHQSDHLYCGLQYVSRLIWANQGGVELSVPFIMYGSASKDEIYGRGVSGLIKVDDETNEARPSKAYYALRLVARATVGGKERLAVKMGELHGHSLLALASRDGEHLYLTLINRTEDVTYKVRLGELARLKDKSYVLREFSEKVNDEVVRQALPREAGLVLTLAPLSVKQLIVER